MVRGYRRTNVKKQLKLCQRTILIKVPTRTRIRRALRYLTLGGMEGGGRVTHVNAKREAAPRARKFFEGVQGVFGSSVRNVAGRYCTPEFITDIHRPLTSSRSCRSAVIAVP